MRGNLRAPRLQGAMSIPVAARSARPRPCPPPNSPRRSASARGDPPEGADRAAVAVQAMAAKPDRVALEALQRSLVPAALPLVTGAEMAARYAPGRGGGRRRLIRRIHLAIGGAVRRDRGRGRIRRPAQRKRAGGTSPKTRTQLLRDRGNATCLAGRKWAARNSPGDSARTSTRLPDSAAKPAPARGLTRSATSRLPSRVDRYASRPLAAMFVVTAA